VPAVGAGELQREFSAKPKFDSPLCAKTAIFACILRSSSRKASRPQALFSQPEGMKILQLCKKFPYPLKDGESIAITALGRSLHRLGHELSLLAMNTSKHFFPIGQLPPDSLQYYKHLRTAEVDNRLRPGAALRSLFGQDSYHITRFVAEAYDKALQKLLSEEEFDIIQLETPYLAPYIPTIRRHSRAAVVMRAHNVEHEIWERITDNTRFWPKRWYLRHLSQRLRQYEIHQLQRYDLLAAITERDLQEFRRLGYQGAGVVAPIGVESSRYTPDYSSFQQPLSLSFIGSLDWMPNQEGLRWFLDQVWWRLRKQHPDLEVHIAGRNAPGWLARLRERGVRIHGEVPNAADFINRHNLMIVPLLSGSGMRAKILEGMALGKAVLTTTIGLEGIQAEHRREVLVGDKPQAFADNVDWALQQGKALEQMGRRARQRVLESYDSLHIARQLARAYEQLNVEAL